MTRRALAFALLAAWPATARAQDAWDRKKEDCDKVLSRRAKAKHVDRIRACTEIWESHRDVAGLTPGEKKEVAHAFSVLSYAGNDRDLELAFAALGRIGMKRLSRKDAGLEADAPADSRYVPDVSPARQAEAGKLLAKGLQQHRRKKYKQALPLYEKAIKADPNLVEAQYRAACAYARLGDVRSAADLLEGLKARDDREARSYLLEARADVDFDKIRSRPEYKKATGYAEIVLLNGAGAEGDPHIKRLKGDLRGAGRGPAFVGTDEASRGRPLVWYKPGFEAVAEEIKNIVEPDKTRLKTIDFNTAIGRYDFDIYVVWGMPHKAALLKLPEVEKRRQGATPAGEEPVNPLEAIKAARGAVEDAGSLMKPPDLPELP